MELITVEVSSFYAVMSLRLILRTCWKIMNGFSSEFPEQGVTLPARDVGN